MSHGFYGIFRLIFGSHEVNLDGVIDAEEFAEALRNRRVVLGSCTWENTFFWGIPGPLPFWEWGISGINIGKKILGKKNGKKILGTNIL